MATVVVVGLGPGDPGLVTAATAAAIAATPVRFVRTRRHPSAHVVGDADSFDDVYDRADTLEDVYATVASRLADAARDHGRVLYAVPGSPLVAERTVELLRSDPGVEVELLPAMSFLDLAWARLGIDPVAAGVRLVDGHRFATEAAGSVGPLLVAQCDTRQVLSEIKLAVDDPPAVPAVLLHHLGLPDESVTMLEWADLDRGPAPDHLSCLWIPALAAPVAAELARFVELVRVLRDRCPWDAAQTHASLRPHALEEAYEVVDAIDDLAGGGPGAWEHLEEELGDLLFQVVLHARLAEQEGQFGLADVARTVHDKLVRRHPHVFGDAAGGDPGALDLSWERGKQAEQARTSVVDGLPAALPPLAEAAKLQRRAATAGLDPTGDGAAAAARLERLGRLAAGADRDGAGRDGADVAMGELLFELVGLGRHLGVDAALALRGASRRFADHVRAVEALGRRRGLDTAGLAGLPAPEREALWREAASG